MLCTLTLLACVTLMPEMAMIVSSPATRTRFKSQLPGVSQSPPVNRRKQRTVLEDLQPRPKAETATIDLVYGLHAKALGITREQFASMLTGMSHTRRHSTLAAADRRNPRYPGFAKDPRCSQG
jgi:hypothetical protein